MTVDYTTETTHAATPDPSTPLPTRATLELPNEDSLHLFGIEGLTLEQARVVAAALSIFISKGKSKSRTKVYVMGSLLISACRTPVYRDGEQRPPALPDLPRSGWPTADTAMRRLGIDHTMIEDYWLTARNRADDSCLPIDWLVGFVPGGFWRAVWQLIEWGPFETVIRVDEAITVLAKTPPQVATRKRPEGSLLAARTLESRIDCLWALLTALVELHGKVQANTNPSLGAEPLALWMFKPPRVDVKEFGAKEARTDTSGPPIPDSAVRLRELHQEWQQALPQRRYRRLRALVLFAILNLYGPRLDALRMLDVDDYLPDYVGKDGVRGPVLRLFPGKTREHDEAYLLPLPGELAEWIEAWIRYTDREIGQTGSPMWPSSKPKPGKPVKRITGNGVYGICAGSKGQHGRDNKRLALFPRGDDPNIGFNPHAYRHTAYQAAKVAGVKAKYERPWEFAHIEPEDFARAICGHSLETDLPDTYLNLQQLQLARAAVPHAWDELWGGGEVLVLDPVAIATARHEHAVLNVAIDEQEEQLQRLHAEQTALARQTTTLSGDKLNAALIASNQIAGETQIVIRDLDRLNQKRDAARQKLEDAMTTKRPIADAITLEENERLVAEALAEAIETETETDGPLADELTVADLADLFGVEPQTINLWYRNGFPAGRPTLWDPDAWIASGPRSKTLPVSAIDQSLLTDAQKDRLVFLRRRRMIPTAA